MRAKGKRRGGKRRGAGTAERTLQVKRACQMSLWDGTEGRCHWCGSELPARRRSWCSSACQRLFEDNHVWSLARRRKRRRAKYRCETCGSREHLEVNHIVPVVGAGYALSCHHHLDNLELLCRACHVQVTNRQREERKGLPDTADLAP